MTAATRNRRADAAVNPSRCRTNGACSPMPISQAPGHRSNSQLAAQPLSRLSAEVFADKGFDAPSSRGRTTCRGRPGRLLSALPRQSTLFALALFGSPVTLLEELAGGFADSGTAFEVLLETIVEQQIAGASPRRRRCWGAGAHPHVEREHRQRVVRVFEGAQFDTQSPRPGWPDFEPRDVLVVLAMVFRRGVQAGRTFEALTNARALQLVYWASGAKRGRRARHDRAPGPESTWRRATPRGALRLGRKSNGDALVEPATEPRAVALLDEVPLKLLPAGHRSSSGAAIASAASRFSSWALRNM